MPAVRKRYTTDDKPAPCLVRIAPDLAAVLYQERRAGRWRDETELVNAIVREWAKGKGEVDWKKLLKELKAEDAEK